MTLGCEQAIQLKGLLQATLPREPSRETAT